MAKCRDCGNPNANFKHYDDSWVCGKCAGAYFTCPDCGRLFDNNDHVNGDQGSGFCKDCSPDH